jgi:hypothetical protein
MARSAKSDRAAVTASSGSSPDRSPSAVASASAAGQAQAGGDRQPLPLGAGKRKSRRAAFGHEAIGQFGVPFEEAARKGDQRRARSSASEGR